MKRMKQCAGRVIVLVLCLAMVAGILPFTTSGAGTVAEARLDSYQQFLAYYYLNFSSLDYYLNNDELPYHTYVNNAGEDFEENLATWKLATMDASDLADYSGKEVDFYILLMYDILYQKTDEDNMLQNFKTEAGAIMASTLLELSDKAVEGAEKLLPEVNIMEDNWEETLNIVVNTKVCVCQLETA